MPEAVTVRLSRRSPSTLSATWSCVLLVLAFASDALAQGPAAESVVGDAADALPGYVRTHVAAERPVGFAARGHVGYALTESLADAPGPHHRVLGGAALSGHPLPWLGLALRFDGRADYHPADAMGRDRGSVATAGLSVRGATRLANGLGLGANVSVGTRGGTSDSFGFDGLVLEATGLASYVRGGFSLAAEGGFRIDRSARALPSNVRFRPGDNLALGVSDFHAVLVRLGAGYRTGAFETFGELSADVLVGDGAPSFARGPLHVAVGARLYAVDALALEAVLDLGASKRGAVGNGDAVPYYVIEPRVALRLGVTYRFARGVEDAAPISEEGVEASPPEDDSAHEAREPVAGERALRGTVLDASGAPLVDAHVVVRVGDVTRDAYADGSGAFAVEGIPPGEATLTITATHHVPVTRVLGDGALEVPADALRMQQAAPAGVIRGLVRNFDGQPLRATVRLRPGAASVQTAADGTFQVEVAPGRYTVSVESPGFASQSRQLELTDGQVTIFNVDLRAE